VPRAKIDALWNAAVRETRDGALGLRIAQALPPNNGGTMQVVALSAPTLEAGLRHLCRYWGLINDGVELSAKVTASRVSLTQRSKNGVHLARPWLDLTAVVLIEAALRALVKPERPIELVVPYARDPFCSELEAAVQTKVTYGGDALELAFRPEVASMPLTTANPALHQVVAAHAEASLSRLLRERAKDGGEGDPSALLAEVRAAVLARLEAGDANLPEVAEAVGLSARTLQRRLADAGTSLRELVDDARRHAAIEVLGRGDVSITELAFLLGFSETSAFDRAFKRWTGKAPADFRAARPVN
jgi:AraC-like DNA-binding protein